MCLCGSLQVVPWNRGYGARLLTNSHYLWQWGRHQFWWWEWVYLIPSVSTLIYDSNPRIRLAAINLIKGGRYMWPHPNKGSPTNYRGQQWGGRATISTTRSVQAPVIVLPPWTMLLIPTPTSGKLRNTGTSTSWRKSAQMRWLPLQLHEKLSVVHQISWKPRLNLHFRRPL